MKITVYRPNQIGGCVTEIESRGGTRIIIDVGSNLPGNVSGNDVDISGITENCAGVFVSHYHGDHIGEYKQVHPPEKIHIGEVAKKIFLTVQTRLSKSERTGVKPEDLEKIAKFKTFKNGDSVVLGDLTITPIRADHSAFDSYMFLVSDGEKRVLHTGDFRTHGWTGKEMEDALREYSGKVHGLICEGTMLSRKSEKVYSESDLYEDAKKILNDNRNVFVLCSSTNIDTIATFYKAAWEHNSLPVADKFQRNILNVVTESGSGEFYELQRTKIYWPDEPKYLKLRQDCLRKMRGMGFCMFIRATQFFEDPLALFPDNIIVYSMWKGYLEDGKPYTDENKKKFLDKAKDNGSKVLIKHTSGHAYEDSIINLCNTVLPKKIFPIHSERPDRFEELKAENKIQSEIKRFTGEKSEETV